MEEIRGTTIEKNHRPDRTEKFTENLSYLMSEVLKLSGNALAREMNMNQGLVSRYRKGTTKPPIDFVIELCRRYDISANWLLLDILPVKLSELTIADTYDITIRQIEEEKQLIQGLDLIVDCVNSIKSKYSL